MFSDWMTTGNGVFSFETLDESIAALETVAAAPDVHGRQAREIAHEYFSADQVLTRLLNDATT